LTRDREDAVSAKPFPTDPSFPQLGVAGNPELMREVFQRHLQPLGEKAYQIRECRISRTRYRQAIRCVVHYDLRLEESCTGRERIQWVSAVMHAGDRTRRIWEELQRSDLGRGIPDTSLPFMPFSYIPELEMLIQVFPYDHGLPALPLLMSGPPPEVEPLLLARFGPGHWQAEAWDIEPVRYLAAVRVTLRLTMRARQTMIGRAEERRFYMKVYREETTGEQTYQVLQALWEKASAGGVGFTVGRPVAYLSGFRTLIQEELPGTSLKEILLREDEATPAMRKTARALASLHLDCMTTPRRRRLWDECTALEERGKLLQQACPHLRSEIEHIVGAVVTGLEEVPPAPTHCDLGLDHILVDDDRLALVDLDAFAKADPILDVANILSQLAIMPLLHSFFPHDRAQMIARTFTEEYFAHVPEAWRTRLPLRYASALLKRAVSLYRNQRAGWPDKIEALVEEAKGSVAGS
jgi:Ser/Thr protein kinase RdoA (MazF antagonist)